MEPAGILGGQIVKSLLLSLLMQSTGLEGLTQQGFPMLFVLQVPLTVWDLLLEVDS